MPYDRELVSQLGSMESDSVDRLAYLVGSARGGTSLALHLMGGHPNMCSFIGPSHFYNQIWACQNAVPVRVLQTLFWAGLSTFKGHFSASLSEDQRNALNRLYARAFSSKSMRDLYDLYPLFRAIDPSVQHPADGYKAWFDKSNDANGLDDIAAAYPEARFLFVFRDPRGAVPTLTTRAAMQKVEADKLALGGVVAQSIYWRNLTQQCLRFASRHPGRSLLFAYERLVTDPETVLSEVYSFLDLPPIGTSATTKLIGKVAFGSTYEKASTGLNPTPIVRWRTAVPQAVIDVISSICGPTARKLGYDVSSLDKVSPAKLLGHISGTRAKAVAGAKLLYLAAREPGVRVNATGYGGPPLLWSSDRDTALVHSMSDRSGAD